MKTTLALAALCLVACRDPKICPVVPQMALESLPATLAETGLFRDGGTEISTDGIRAYTPQFPLWSDGLEKRRWVKLPPGSTIDSTDMDFWQFPEGTRFWKEFSKDGKHLETRVLQKTAGAWVMASYVWNEAQTGADLTPAGASHVLGTTHDVPAAAQCQGCHSGTASHVLGFSAIQLAHTAMNGELVLSEVMTAKTLTVNPASEPVVPGTQVERAALGYLHANCGHCHNQTRPMGTTERCYDPEKPFDLLLRVGSLESVEVTPTYKTALGSVIQRGHPETSQVYKKASKTAAQGGMPPLAKDVVDDEALKNLNAWISGL